MEILTLKWLHLLSATVVFGTGLGIAYFKWCADRTGRISDICFVNARVVRADWLFTTPAIVTQAITGYLLVEHTGRSLSEPWLVLSLVLFLIAGLCWIPVVILQINMLKLSQQVLRQSVRLPVVYKRKMQTWFWLGGPAFLSLIAIFYLMAAKPNF